MKSAVVVLCLSLFVASHAFILGGDGMRSIMTLNMLNNRNPLDFSMLGLGGPQQGQASTGVGATKGSSGTASTATGTRSGLFSNPLFQLSLLGGEGFF